MTIDREKFYEINFPIIRETDKAIYVQTQVGCASNVDHFMWIPKSVCVIEKDYCVGKDEHGNEIYEDKLRAVAKWFARKNKLDR
jgi:hypothetical protein